MSFAGHAKNIDRRSCLKKVQEAQNTHTPLFRITPCSGGFLWSYCRPVAYDACGDRDVCGSQSLHSIAQPITPCVNIFLAYYFRCCAYDAHCVPAVVGTGHIMSFKARRFLVKRRCPVLISTRQRLYKWRRMLPLVGNDVPGTPLDCLSSFG